MAVNLLELSALPLPKRLAFAEALAQAVYAQAGLKFFHPPVCFLVGLDAGKIGLRDLPPFIIKGGDLFGISSRRGQRRR